MYHEQYPKFQSDKSDVNVLVGAFEQLGNPLLEDGGELFDFDQSVIMSPDVVDSVIKVKKIGWHLYTAFVNKRVGSPEEAFQYTKLI